MKLKILDVLTIIRPTTGNIKPYKSNPGYLELACHAAVQKAASLKEDLLIVPGNSYCKRVFHIAKTNEDIKKYCPGMKFVNLFYVKQSGEIRNAVYE